MLKARQRGITTLIAVLWLDTALFSAGPIYCGIVAHEREAAEEIFRTKVVFAYDNLPDVLKAQFPVTKKTATELVFGHNGATIRVATSMRSSTIHRLHVSELGKIAAKYPMKAREVLTGSVPAVPASGVLVVESTAEGQDGAFFDLCKISKAASDEKRTLSAKDYKFHFFSWWDADEYRLDPSLVSISDTDAEYFRRVEGIIKREISPEKRAWYVATRRSDFADDAPLMWQEYPSYPDEAFAVSMDGCYYATQITTARLQGRMFDHLPKISAPVNSFWDIGKGDMTCIWLHQRVGPENRFIGYYEASGEDLDHYAAWLQGLGVVFGTHYLPHEADHKRIGKDPDHNQSIREMLGELLPGQNFETVPRVTQLQAGIQATRRQFSTCWFDSTACEQGIKRLTGYRKHWDKTRGCWSDNHEHNDDSHGADAFRQFGQTADRGDTFAVVSAPAPRRAASSWRA
ncbi:MAG: terminase [Candidatus Accumulibacter sp.]|nr:terminase [Accumulibacter sp.]